MRGPVVLLVLVGVAGGCGYDPPTQPEPVGTLRVAIATIGADLDLDGYGLVVDDAAEQSVGANETVVIPMLPVGAHDVVLTGVAENCGVNGPTSRSVTVADQDTSRVAYAVTCRATGVKVTAATTGVDRDPDGYQVSVDNGAAVPLGALGSVIVTRLTPGPHTIALTGIASNCILSDENPRAVVVTLGELTPVSFAVTCLAGTGALAVTAATTGIDLDAYYVIQIPGGVQQPVPVNGTLVITGLAPGDLAVSLDDVAANCAVVGANPRAVTITAGGATIDTARVTFDVACMAASGVIEVTAATSGEDHDRDGYAVRLDGGVSQPVGANTVVTFEAIGGGDHTLTLESVAGNCAVSGNNPRTVTVSVGGAVRDTARAAFEVSCARAWAIAFARASDVSKVLVANATGTEQAEFALGDAPAWSPDGTRLAFVNMACDYYYYYYYYYYCYPTGLQVAGTAGSGTDTLTTSSVDVDPAWRPDGARLAFARGSTLYLINADGSGVTPLTNAGNAAHPTWSADGTRLAFTCQVVANNSDICAINADGTGLVRLTSDGARDTRPAWSPDGSKIVFVTTRYTGGQELALMNPDGTGLTRLSPGTGAIQPAWSADGTKIVYTAYRCDIYTGCTTLGLSVMNADGTGASQITTGRDSGSSWRP